MAVHAHRRTLREWSTRHQGHEIHVTLHWWLRAELRVDGQLQDQRTLLVATDSRIHLLTGRMPDFPPGSGLIKVFFPALWSPTLELQVEGTRIRLMAGKQPARTPRKSRSRALAVEFDLSQP